MYLYPQEVKKLPQHLDCLKMIKMRMEVVELQERHDQSFVSDKSSCDYLDGWGIQKISHVI